jgi:hypothetical protein
MAANLTDHRGQRATIPNERLLATRKLENGIADGADYRFHLSGQANCSFNSAWALLPSEA